MNKPDIIFIIATAFTASIGHCVGMCGGIVLAYSGNSSIKNSKWKSLRHLAYNLGRVTTYTIIGILFGAVGKVMAFTELTKGILFAITGILMILAGLSLTGKLGFLNKLEVSFSHRPWYGKVFGKLLRADSLKAYYGLGMLNGIIPCGLVYSFAVIAAATSSPWYGGLVMFIFGLSTIPTLFTLGYISDYLQKGSIRKVMMRVSAVLVILYGVYTLYKGYKFIRYPEQMKQMMEQMHTRPPDAGQKCGGMKCSPGKCG